MVDVIILYVDSRDKKWLNLRKSVFPNEKIDPKRYEPDGSLKFLFRAVDKNLPFIRKIHFVVQIPSQVPSWLDTSKVNIVLHEDFIPKQFLPTYNSNAIAQYISQIPDLAERYIILNDDTFPMNLCTEDDFFNEKGLPIIDFVPYKELTDVWCNYIKNAHSLVTKYFSKDNALKLRPSHQMTPGLKSSTLECLEHFKQEIHANQMTKLRENTNYCYLRPFYDFYNNSCVPNIISRDENIFIVDKQHLDLFIEKSKVQKKICINEVKSTLKKDYLDALSKKFPNKSSYELFENDLLTIIIPIYNVSLYLIKSLYSIQNQTYKNFECLLINDGSTDNSEEICLNFVKNDNRFKYFKKENGGVSSARNLGIENISKDSVYTAFFDPDDFVEFDYYESIITAMKMYNTDLGCGRRVRVPDFTKLPTLNRVDKQNAFSYHGGPSFFLWQHVCSTKVIRENNIKFLPICHYEDAIFIADVFGFSKNRFVGYENSSYYIYTDKRSGSICHTSYEKNKQRTIDALPIQIEHLNTLKSNPKFNQWGVDLENNYINDTKKILKNRFNVVS